jgi:hypothetical protein
MFGVMAHGFGVKRNRLGVKRILGILNQSIFEY